MSNQEDFDECDDYKKVFVGDECICVPTPLKKDEEWLDYFMGLNGIKYKIVEQDKYNYDDSAYLMIRNIGYLFAEMGDFSCNKDKELFELWGKKESVIKKRIEVINKCLDVYDIIFPYTNLKPILSKDDLMTVHNLMDRLFYDIAYPIMNEIGVDLNMELGSPGWLDLKKVLLRFFSKIKLDREFERFEEEVEGTGHIRPLYRKDGSSLKGTGTFLLKFTKEDENEKVDLNQ